LRVASDGVDEIRSRSVPKRFRNGEGLLQCPAMARDERMKDFHARRAKARAMGGPERLARFLTQARTRSAIGRHRLAGWPTKF